jgi:hypothetical protein
LYTTVTVVTAGRRPAAHAEQGQSIAAARLHAQR